MISLCCGDPLHPGSRCSNVFICNTCNRVEENKCDVGERYRGRTWLLVIGKKDSAPLNAKKIRGALIFAIFHVPNLFFFYRFQAYFSNVIFYHCFIETINRCLN